MKESFAKVLYLVSVNEKISGRKKFQKLVYILKHKGFDFKEDYSYYYYGPYSSTLQMEIDALVHSDLLLENCIDNITYEYSVTEKAKEYMLDDIFSSEDIRFINRLNEKPATILELVSVLFYLQDSGYTEKEALISKTKALKPDIAGHIDEAYAVFSDINSYSFGGQA